MAFTKKRLRISLSLANGIFANGGNSAILEGYRCSVQINYAGSPGMGVANIAIYGLSLSEMNQLTTLGTQIFFMNQNRIAIEASEDDGNTYAQVFSGTINTAYPDGQSMPDVALRIMATAGGYESVQKIPPTTINGTGDVATLMGQLAGQAGLSFENNSVNIKLSNPYLFGSVRDQMLSLAKAAGIGWIIELGICAIWKLGQPRQVGTTFISPETGLVGYPAFNQAGIVVTTKFLPTLRFGAQITVQSDFTAACGSWNIYNLTYDLESNVPKGKWFCIAQCTPINVDQSDS